MKTLIIVLLLIFISGTVQAKPDAEECRKAREDGFILYDCVDHSIVQVTNIVIFPEANIDSHHRHHKIHQGREAKHVVHHAKRITKR